MDRTDTFHDEFLDGNELIEEAVERFYADSSMDTLIAVLGAVRQRMHADGHLLIPVTYNEDGSFVFRNIQTKDVKVWVAAFTSEDEFRKGESSKVLSYFINSMLEACAASDLDGMIINPWGQSFLLDKDLIKAIFEADGDVEYFVPEIPEEEEVLQDGSLARRAVEICGRNLTQLNLIKLLKILHKSSVWIPCNSILSDADYAVVKKTVMDAMDGEGLGSLTGKVMTNQDEVRLVPDILQNEDGFFFPVFTSEEEMGEYGEHFSKVESDFLEAVVLARNNEKDVKGIVINAFTGSCVISRDLFDFIEAMEEDNNGQR